MNILLSFPFALLVFVLLFSAMTAIGKPNAGWRVAFGVLAILTLADVLMLFGVIHA